jgi:hypothetical protein
LVCDDEIKIYDIRNPIEPVLVNSIDRNCFDVKNTLFAIGSGGVYCSKLNPANIKDIRVVSKVKFLSLLV